MTDHAGPSVPTSPVPGRAHPAAGFRCSDAARGRGDQLTGTAPPATRWLLVEHPGAWGLDELAAAVLDPSSRHRLKTGVAEAGARLLLIRRPSRRGSLVPDARRWMVVRRGAATVQGQWGTASELDAAVDVLHHPPSERRDGAPLILVCTHGARDVCCAVRGRPIAAELARRWPEETWETSHVGGDRFAPNVVLLPDGAYYGGLDPDTATEVVADHLAGRVRPDFLRGCAGYPPAAQAAMTAVLAHLGSERARDLGYLDTVSERGTGWLVTFALGADRIAVRVLAAPAPAQHLTCRARRETSALVYRVADIDALEGIR